MCKRVLSLLIVLLAASITHADYLGSWAIDDNLTVMATLHRADTGAASAADGAVDLWVYEDTNNVQILDLTMSGFDTITGLYEEQFVLSAANGFEQGKTYTVLIQATVNSISAIKTHSFQIQADVNTSTPPTAGAIADAVWDEASADHTTENTFGGELGTLDPNITAILADTNDLQTDWTNGGRLDLIIDTISTNVSLGSVGRYAGIYGGPFLPVVAMLIYYRRSKKNEIEIG
jgi:hypothetical protein